MQSGSARRASITGRALVATVLVVAAGSAGIALANAAPTGPVTQHVVSAAPLVEVPSCWDAHTPGPTYPDTDGQHAVETISVTIEPTALIRVDERGRVVAATTNTGCAPRPGDRVYLQRPGGDLVETPGFDVTAVRWVGDFTEFGWQRQGG